MYSRERVDRLVLSAERFWPVAGGRVSILGPESRDRDSKPRDTEFSNSDGAEVLPVAIVPRDPFTDGDSPNFGDASVVTYC